MKVSILFPSDPPLDTKFAIQGQDYKLIDSEPYERKDGTSTTLLVWETHCAQCAAMFYIKTPLGFTTGQPRRCEAHRDPGKKVRRVAKVGSRP